MKMDQVDQNAKIKIFEKRDEWQQEATREIYEWILKYDSEVVLGLCGGSTPGPVYSQLAASRGVNLAKLKTFLIDERCVPADENTSNTKLVMHTLYEKADLLAKNNFCFPTYNQDLEKMRVVYESELEQILSMGRPLGLVVGVGTDGHFASIFPGWKEQKGIVWLTETTEFEVKERLTVSPFTLAKADKIIVLIRGQEKQVLLDEITHGKKAAEEFPMKMLLKHPDLTILFSRE
ncbi:6-phosphogluconolactonase [Candidatus Peregrinibacteria bacterium]|nr:6-phosphogluconolactonase [Candidatus Peregrinibacteria bacterium]